LSVYIISDQEFLLKLQKLKARNGRRIRVFLIKMSITSVMLAKYCRLQHFSLSISIVDTPLPHPVPLHSQEKTGTVREVGI